MITKIELELDTDANLEPGGIEILCFLEDEDCYPVVEYVTTWDNLVNLLFERHTIPLMRDEDIIPIEGDTNPYGTRSIYAIAIALEKTAEKIRKRLEASKILDRNAWIKSGDESPDSYIKQFSYDLVE